MVKQSSYPIGLKGYAYNEQDIRPYMEPHEHPQLELNYLVAGEADVYYTNPKTGKTEHLKMFPNNFIIISPLTLHCINSTVPVKYFVLELNAAPAKQNIVDYLRQSQYVNKFTEAVKLLDNWSDVLLFKDTQNIPHLLNKFRQFIDYGKRDCFYDAHLEICLKQLFIAIIQCATEGKTLSGQNVHIKRALSYLQSNYDKDISVKDVADYTGLSFTHLHRIFKDAMGTGVINKLNEIRIKKAAQLLLDSNHSVKSVSQMTGFNSVQTFKYNFKKAYKKPPAEYKQDELSKIVRLSSIDYEKI